MNYQLIRQFSMIFQSNRVLLLSNTVKLKQNPLNNVKLMHISAQHHTPRFTKDLKSDELTEKLPESITGPELHAIKDKILSKRPTRNAEESDWDAVEAGMFKGRKPKGVEIPNVTFKGNRAFVQKERSLFNMDEIDRRSKKHNDVKNVKQTQAKPKPIKKMWHPEEVYDQDIGKYLKLERDDPLLDNLMMKIQSKKQGDPDQKKFTLEGSIF